MIKRVRINEIKNIYEYENIRNDFRKGIIELKIQRRISAGERIGLVFENHETVLYQIQEMIRTERLVRGAAIQHEMEVYNGILPGENELSATFFIEIDQSEEIKPWLDKLHGIDDGKCVWIEVNHEKIFAFFEEGHSNEEKLSSVHYVRFPFLPSAKEAFLDPGEKAYLLIQHSAYQAKAEIQNELRKQLISDLAS
jgi:hypothetical protein